MLIHKLCNSFCRHRNQINPVSYTHLLCRINASIRICFFMRVLWFYGLYWIEPVSYTHLVYLIAMSAERITEFVNQHHIGIDYLIIVVDVALCMMFALLSLSLIHIYSAWQYQRNRQAGLLDVSRSFPQHSRGSVSYTHLHYEIYWIAAPALAVPEPFISPYRQAVVTFPTVFFSAAYEGFSLWP